MNSALPASAPPASASTTRGAAALPAPDADALAHSARVAAAIGAAIDAAGGWIPFHRYMELALYAPGLGYYMAGARKLGGGMDQGADFVTAPELSPLFGQCLARQAAQVTALCGGGDLLEIGAGSGALAASLLEELERMQALPERYLILELSPELRARCRDTLAARVPHLIERVAWLNALPPAFTGCVIGNEVLDAMPADVFERGEDGIRELGVRRAAPGEAGDFAWAPAPGAAAPADPERFPVVPYRTEVQRIAQGLVRSVGAMLERGAAIFIDYGFPRAEYHHPERREGTLMCHYRHRAHADPFFLPGLQDITVHVDFSAMADAARQSGLELLGYTSQAAFLIGCGVTELLSRVPPEDARRYLPLANQANRLLSPAEMGELFKAIAFGRGIGAPLEGFSVSDRRGML